MMVDEEAPTRRRRQRLSTENVELNEGSPRGRTREKRRHKRRSRRDDDLLDQPFYVLVMQVGTTLFTLCLVSFYLYRSFIPSPPSAVDTADLEVEEVIIDDAIYADLDEEEQEVVSMPTQSPTIPTAPPLPVWDLGEGSKYDAFGIVELYQQYETQTDGGGNSVKNNNNPEDLIVGNKAAFWTMTESLRLQFAELYGGENAVRAIMERGLTTFPMPTTTGTSGGPPSDVVATACRIQNAQKEDRAFKVTFGGYSVTVGRGNYFSQSFPFVMNRILEPPFKLLGINLSVKNAAIGGCKFLCLEL